ncbi:hypothetical protein [endosymbiont of Lamellibrachia barhami]|uniref:hypothetical protein n=1 Tax=endosymbiont of Lamellibrachia barhami TaxID=205975 RepID=UPI001FE85C0C|nr:hypothetical protein [endosymbiont of Lamellibrachia barhami]
MSISRREFLHLMGLAGAAGMMPGSIFAATRQPADLYEVPKFGNVSLLHFTDTHAQLNPIYFREPNVNLGLGYAFNKAPHLVGDKLLNHFGIAPNGIESHAFSYLNFNAASAKYGKIGGFAHLRTLVDRIRAERGPGNTLLMDGGDTWQGSGTAYWTRGKDMVGACNMLGVDVMTGHWEFTYHDKEVISNIHDFKGEFIAQNVKVNDDALFDYKFADFADFDEDEGFAFKPYVIKNVGGARVAVIGQAFPYTPIANPQRFIPDWTFGIQDESMQAVVDMVRENEKPDVVVVLSHNGMDVDIKMASGSAASTLSSAAIPTMVCWPRRSSRMPAARPSGDHRFQRQSSSVSWIWRCSGKVRIFATGCYRSSNLLPADKEMQAYIDGVRAPKDQLDEKLGGGEETLSPW